VIHIGDCLEVMKTLDAGSIDAIVTDPPYGLSFMGKDWDHGIPGESFWREALRVAKPGTHLLAFGGTRTFHRLTVAIEDAGWEIRDCIMWVYGSGFPKSHDVSKAIDREAGAEREVVGPKITGDGHIQNRQNGTNAYGTFKIAQDGIDMFTAPATDAAQQWQGWGTALKPAWEPIIVARKPLAGTVAQNVQEYGTGAVNVDGCRIKGDSWTRPGSNGIGGIYGDYGNDAPRSNTAGRWPANLIHDGSDEVVGLMPSNAPSGSGNKSPKKQDKNNVLGKGLGWSPNPSTGGDTGSAARFFYCSKASKADRDSGLDGWESRANGIGDERPSGQSMQRLDGRDARQTQNHHPTVKPNDLMRYLCRLVTPPGGTVFDPFCGSGSTGKAAVMEGFQFIGIELNPEYAAIAEARIRAEVEKTPLLEAIR
jgi:DNA modification methylase